MNGECCMGRRAARRMSDQEIIGGIILAGIITFVVPVFVGSCLLLASKETKSNSSNMLNTYQFEQKESTNNIGNSYTSSVSNQIKNNTLNTNTKKFHYPSCSSVG